MHFISCWERNGTSCLLVHITVLGFPLTVSESYLPLALMRLSIQQWGSSRYTGVVVRWESCCVRCRVGRKWLACCIECQRIRSGEGAGVACRGCLCAHGTAHLLRQQALGGTQQLWPRRRWEGHSWVWDVKPSGGRWIHWPAWCLKCVADPWTYQLCLHPPGLSNW